MTTTEHIKTGQEVSNYLRKYNEYCKKTAAGQRTRQPSTDLAWDEMTALNPGKSIQHALDEVRAALRANHGLSW